MEDLRTCWQNALDALEVPPPFRLALGRCFGSSYPTLIVSSDTGETHFGWIQLACWPGKSTALRWLAVAVASAALYETCKRMRRRSTGALVLDGDRPLRQAMPPLLTPKTLGRALRLPVAADLVEAMLRSASAFAVKV